MSSSKLIAFPFKNLSKKKKIYPTNFHLNKSDLLLLTKSLCILAGILNVSIIVQFQTLTLCLQCLQNSVTLSVCHRCLSFLVSSQREHDVYTQLVRQSVDFGFDLSGPQSLFCGLFSNGAGPSQWPPTQWSARANNAEALLIARQYR